MNGIGVLEWNKGAAEANIRSLGKNSGLFSEPRESSLFCQEVKHWSVSLARANELKIPTQINVQALKVTQQK